MSKDLDSIISNIFYHGASAGLAYPKVAKLSENNSRGFKAQLQSLVKGCIEKPVHSRDSDGYCDVCEGFLEDDDYSCYCDVRAEAIDGIAIRLKGKGLL